MDHFVELPTIARSRPSLVPEDTAALPVSSLGAEAEAGSVLPPVVSYGQNASCPPYGILRYDFNGPELQLQLQGLSGLTAECEHPTLRPQAPPPAPIRSTRNPDIGYAMSLPSSSSEHSIHPSHAQHVSAVVVNNRSAYTLSHEPERAKIRAIFPFPRIVRALPHGQVVVPPSYPEHVTRWYEVQSQAVIINGPREFVPQTIYQPGYEGDRRRYVSLVTFRPPIIFLAEDSPEWGIPVLDLLSNESARVAGGDEPAFAPCGPSIAIRVQWPGYQPRHKRVSTRDYTPERCMITKARLAKIVAKCVSKFVDTMSAEAGSDRQWKIGLSGIRVDDIILVSLHHVSQGSWQPQLRLRRAIRPAITVRQYGHGGGEVTGETWAS